MNSIPGTASLLGLACLGFSLLAAPASGADATLQQRHFDSPDAALTALSSATSSGDRVALNAIFGPEVKDLLSGDPKQDALEAAAFAKALRRYARWVARTDTFYVLDVGDQNWPMPIPLVKRDGFWVFDTAAGKEEILSRRIGEDELNAIGVCHAYVQAQREYAADDHDASGIFKYAQKLKSSPGRKDGLFWPSSPGVEESPFGPLVAEARVEGYGGKTAEGTPQPYKGYRFKILKGQGASAPGGAYSYVINGNMVAGFAMVAYPAHWGESGVMTFLVNQSGRVYQCNLGEQSAAIAAAMTDFNPDSDWTPVASP